MTTDEVRKCRGPCGQFLPRWMFHTSVAASDGLVYQCVDCQKEYDSKRQEQKLELKRQRDYNMYPGQWEVELKKQNYECDFPSCHCKENLVVDHDHKTGKFRAILCRKHNWGLGHFDNPQLLRDAANYLEKHNV